MSVQEVATVAEIREIIALRLHLRDLLMRRWLEHHLFAPGWWALLVFFAGSLVLWWRAIDRKRLPEMLLFGLMVAATSTFLDDLGLAAVLWVYDVRLFPILHPIPTLNFGVLPISYTLVHQAARTWRAYVVNLLLLAAGLSFVGEPVATRLGIYLLVSWRHVYSFPIYFLLGLFYRWAIIRLFPAPNESAAGS